MGRYDIPGPKCRHKPAGTMSNQPMTEPHDRSRPLSATHVCARQECQDDAREWIRATTGGQDGVFTTFEQNRAASAAQAGES